MKKISTITLFITLLLGFVAQAQEQGRSRSAARRAYAGGRDDSDLTVQSLRQSVKKEGEGEHDEPIGPEYDATTSEAGFGE